MTVFVAGGQFIPCVQWLSDCKSEESYVDVLSTIRRVRNIVVVCVHHSLTLVMQIVGAQFRPRFVMLDFEQAYHNAISSAFGSFSLSCSFHLMQSVVHNLNGKSICFSLFNL
jgi:hypothetical protein